MIFKCNNPACGSTFEPSSIGVSNCPDCGGKDFRPLQEEKKKRGLGLYLGVGVILVAAVGVAAFFMVSGSQNSLPQDLSTLRIVAETKGDPCRIYLGLETADGQRLNSAELDNFRWQMNNGAFRPTPTFTLPEFPGNVFFQAKFAAFDGQSTSLPEGQPQKYTYDHQERCGASSTPPNGNKCESCDFDPNHPFFSINPIQDCDGLNPVLLMGLDRRNVCSDCGRRWQVSVNGIGLNDPTVAMIDSNWGSEVEIEYWYGISSDQTLPLLLTHQLNAQSCDNLSAATASEVADYLDAGLRALSGGSTARLDRFEVASGGSAVVPITPGGMQIEVKGQVKNWEWLDVQHRVQLGLLKVMSVSVEGQPQNGKFVVSKIILN